MMANVRLPIGYLSSGPLFSGLGLHLLDLQRVHPPAAHKQIMVPNAQLEDLHQEKKSKMNACTTALVISHIQAAPASVPEQLTSLLTRKRDELNLKTLVFLSRGLMVNCI